MSNAKIKRLSKNLNCGRECSMDSTLATGEQLVAQVHLRTTILSKASYRLTNKRLVASKTKTFLGLFPIGSSESTYPLGNISSVAIGTHFKFSSFLVGSILALLGVATLAKGIGIIVFIIGVAVLVGSLRGAFIIGNNAGQSMSHMIYFTARGEAKQFVEQVNSVIANRT